ncbi:GNAT family N-acetyltransferase [Sphingomonas turrisvirgatae]|uniref:GNAT family N-acetyltransferase n=1 Tax=Sphingomonas turrisvirgatae TaxID=1888892 RepID=A0A1E3LS73_9SPHN|nr:GNAT family N-acetyltransferase [Sphingomonas turrisvirgatae]ODP36606.1 GNAT family N-acetyltransferase [Sphingomonas turrisvirgatae]
MTTLRPATLADAAALKHVFDVSFVATFGHLYDPADLAAFMAGSTLQSWQERLTDERFTGCVAQVGGIVAGYVLLGPPSLPGDWPADTVELRTLYILPDHQGLGLGTQLLEWAIGSARARGGQQLSLSVFVDNHRARRLYERYGFTDVGRYDFKVGNHVDEDRLMLLAL